MQNIEETMKKSDPETTRRMARNTWADEEITMKDGNEKKGAY